MPLDAAHLHITRQLFDALKDLDEKNYAHKLDLNIPDDGECDEAQDQAKIPAVRIVTVGLELIHLGSKDQHQELIPRLITLLNLIRSLSTKTKKLFTKASSTEKSPTENSSKESTNISTAENAADCLNKYDRESTRYVRADLNNFLKQDYSLSPTPKTDKVLNMVKQIHADITSGYQRSRTFTFNNEYKLKRLEGIINIFEEDKYHAEKNLGEYLLEIKYTCRERRNPLGLFKAQSELDFDSFLHDSSNRTILADYEDEKNLRDPPNYR